MKHRFSLILAALVLLGACADPLSDFERLDDVALAEGGAAASVAPGIADGADAPLVVPGLIAGITGNGGAPDDPQAVAADAAAQAVSAPVAVVTPGPGLFASLFGGGSAASRTGAALPGVAPASVVIPGGTVLPPGTALSFGVIATVCGIDASDMGTLVASASGYGVYDTDPTSTGLRTQYITGFADDCARQFTAALAIFGDIPTHEIVRYSGTADAGYSTTDRAYETIKASYCGVGARTPCGARLEALSQRTTFLTIYRAFGTADGFADILLSDGEVIADDF